MAAVKDMSGEELREQIKLKGEQNKEARADARNELKRRKENLKGGLIPKWERQK